VAAHLEPDILLIDEVLAVGDARFQSKCLGKLGEAWEGGHTVLFVSHNMTAVASLCKRVCWLDKGQVRMVGPAGEVVAAYLSAGEKAVRARTWAFNEAPGDETVRLKSVAVMPVGGIEGDLITTRTALDLDISFWNLKPDANLNLSIQLYTREGVCAFSTWTDSRSFDPGLIVGRCRIPANLLNQHSYRALLRVNEDRFRTRIEVTNSVEFDVHDVHREIPWYGKVPGAVRPELNWSFELVSGERPSPTPPAGAEVT
jgi:lipopolysaccharide transport system ATP-binding protein